MILVSEINQLAILKQARIWFMKEQNVKLSKGGKAAGASGSNNARNEGRADGSSYGLSKPSATRKIA